MALKTLHDQSDSSAQQRFWREARAAARLNHPNICQIYDVGEHEGRIYLAMELLEGDPLGERISRGDLSPVDSLEIGIAILAALEALHDTSIVHRDLKPNNVFVTPHGVKLLDFGLALPITDGATLDERLTAKGAFVGTPRYMAPEQWIGKNIGPPADLFACGALLFEMLSGRPAFGGENVPAICHAITSQQPPVLAGGTAVDGIDRIIHRALAKTPDERYPSAAEMASDLSEQLERLRDSSSPNVEVHAITRLIVLPFRLARPDPEIYFLAFGLADAVTSSLSGLNSLVVRSATAVAGLSAEQPDLRRLASEAEVDAALFWTLLRGGDQIRVTTQLVEVPSGTVLSSGASQVDMSDVFQVQDELTRQVVESLAVPLSAREESLLNQDVSVSPRAYELYLRANHGINTAADDSLVTARELYRQCVVEDPGFAPAWARLGRVSRVLAKYGRGDVERLRQEARNAFDRALSINPDLGIAHNYYSYLEVEELLSPQSAIRRLLKRASSGVADPDLYAGLVVACRYGGLLEASIAAGERARRLDSSVKTSVHYTLWMAGEYEAALEADTEDGAYVSQYCLAQLGRLDELQELNSRIVGRTKGVVRALCKNVGAAAFGDREGVIATSREVLDGGFSDREGLYFVAHDLAYVGEQDRALELLEEIVTGYACVYPLETDPWLEDLRGRPEFAELLETAGALRDESRQVFEEAGGFEILGIQAPQPTRAGAG